MCLIKHPRITLLLSNSRFARMTSCYCFCTSKEYNVSTVSMLLILKFRKRKSTKRFRETNLSFQVTEDAPHSGPN